MWIAMNDWEVIYKALNTLGATGAGNLLGVTHHRQCYCGKIIHTEVVSCGCLAWAVTTLKWMIFLQQHSPECVVSLTPQQLANHYNS